MKILSKREVQQITFNHSSDIDFQEFMNLYKRCTAKLHSFLVINTTLASDKFSCFRNFLYTIIFVYLIFNVKVKLTNQIY